MGKKGRGPRVEKLTLGYYGQYRCDRISHSALGTLHHVRTSPEFVHITPESKIKVERKRIRKVLFICFEMEFHSCGPGWSAVAQSLLTVTSAFQVQRSLLPQPPERLVLQACTTKPG